MIDRLADVAPFTMTDEEKIDRLRRLSDAATPGPWIRRWGDLAVHHMLGDDALTAQGDIDFAVHACAFVRQLITEIDDAQDRQTESMFSVHPYTCRWCKEQWFDWNLYDQHFGELSVKDPSHPAVNPRKAS